MKCAQLKNIASFCIYWSPLLNYNIYWRYQLGNGYMSTAMG